MIRVFFYFAIVIITISCNKESNDFPKSYTFDTIEQTDEGLYRVEDATHLSALPLTAGSYGANRVSFKSDIRELMEIAFNLIEIELLTQDSLFFHYAVDNEEYDTTFTYANVNGDIVIDGLQGTLLTFEKDDDQFVVCGVTTFAIPGPNASDPDLPYDVYDITECTPGFSNLDYANRMLNQYDFGVHDTIGVVVTRYLYK